MYKEAISDEGQVIFSKLAEFAEFYLADGTGLALQLGHRVSEDFDMFSDQFIPGDLLSDIERIFSNKSVSPSVNNSEELTIFLNNVKVTFLRYPFPLLGDTVSFRGVALMEAKEIAATKAYTLGRRGSYKDYVDMYFCIKDGLVTLDELITMADKKYGEKFNSRLFLEQLLYFEDIEEEGLKFLRDPVDKYELESFFKKRVEEYEL